jgi:hypothetical protein
MMSADRVLIKSLLVASCLDDALGPGNYKKKASESLQGFSFFLVKLFFQNG